MPQKVFASLLTAIGISILYLNPLKFSDSSGYIVLGLFIIYYLVLKLFSIPIGSSRMTVAESLVFALMLYQDSASAMWMVATGQGMFWLWCTLRHRDKQFTFQFLIFKIFRQVVAIGTAGTLFNVLIDKNLQLGIAYPVTVLIFWIVSSGAGTLFVYFGDRSQRSIYPYQTIRTMLYYRAILALIAPVLAVILEKQGYPALMVTVIVLLALAQGFASDQLKKKVESTLSQEIEQHETLRQSNEEITGLFQEASQQARDLTLLYTISNLINNTLVRERSIEPVLDCITQTLMCSGTSLFILNPEKTELQFVESLSEDIQFSVLLPEYGPLAKTISSRGIVRWEQGEIIDPVTKKLFDRYLAADSIISVPIEFGNDIIGVLCLANSKYERLLENTELLRGLANQLGTAIEHLKKISEMENLAVTDGLTGVYNYRYFANALQQQKNNAVQNRNISLVVLDIDNFKSINDTYGHATGDLILQSISSIMKENVREGDLICRTGGEEFSIIMPSATSERGCQVAERLRHAVELLDFTEHGLWSPVTVSVGIASYPLNTNDILHLPKLADEAMYIVKRGGRNSVAASVEKNINIKKSLRT